VYAVFNYAVFRPVPGIAEPERLVTLFVWPDHETPHYGYLDDDHLRAIRAMPAFEGLVPLHGWSFPFRVDATVAPDSRSITLVSHGYFNLLGVEPRLGRLFREEEYDQPSPVAVISEKLWRSHYGGDPSVIGSDAFILEHRFTIVGVARDFRGLANIGRDDVWVPKGPAGLARHSLPASPCFWRPAFPPFSPHAGTRSAACASSARERRGPPVASVTPSWDPRAAAADLPAHRRRGEGGGGRGAAPPRPRRPRPRAARCRQGRGTVVLILETVHSPYGHQLSTVHGAPR